MHFYSDVNIFGLNDVVLINYKYRENLSESIMNKFEKISFYNTISQSQNLSDLDYLNINLIELKKEAPYLFSHLTLII